VNDLVTFAAVCRGIGRGEENTMLQNKGFVGVKRAAEILDVAPNTVRAWGASGKITEYRHPANNYRLYKQNELEAFLKQVENTARDEQQRKESH
jgi:hypothetical protein